MWRHITTRSISSIARSGASTCTTATGGPATKTPEDAAAALVDLVADRLDLAPGQVVCDIGCGYGATAQALAETHDVAVTGITLSTVQHERAARRGVAQAPRRSRCGTGSPTAFPPPASTVPMRSRGRSTWTTNDGASRRHSEFCAPEDDWSFARGWRTPAHALGTSATSSGRSARRGGCLGSAMRWSMWICFAGRVSRCRAWKTSARRSRAHGRSASAERCVGSLPTCRTGASFSAATPAIEYLPSRCSGCCWPSAPARCATLY